MGLQQPLRFAHTSRQHSKVQTDPPVLCEKNIAGGSESMTVSKRLPQSVSGLLGKWPAEETVGVQKLLTRATGPCDESGPPSAYNDPVMRPSVNSFMAGIAQTTSMQHTPECFMGDCRSFVLVLTLSCCLVDVQLLGLVDSRPLRPPGRHAALAKDNQPHQRAR